MYTNHNQKDFLSGILLGGTIATLAAVFLNSNKGKKLQKQVGELCEKVGEDIKDVFSEAADTVKETAKSAKEKAEEVASNAKDKVEEVKDSAKKNHNKKED